MVSSYCSVVTLDAGVKRARTLVLRASMVADGTVVAIRGLLRVGAPGRADLQPNASCARLASEDSEPEDATQGITSSFWADNFSSSGRALTRSPLARAQGRPQKPPLAV